MDEGQLVEAADRAVAGSKELQRYVRGERVGVVPSGTLAFIAVNLLMLMYWLGTSIVVGAFASHEARRLVTPVMAVGMVPALCLISNRVVLGMPWAHRTMFHLTTDLVVACALAILALAVRLGVRQVEVLFWVCLGSGVVAHRLVRSPAHALCAAFFRAKRGYHLELDRRKQQLR